MPAPLAEAMTVYAASSLLFAGLESLLAQRISRILAEIPLKVRTWERDQR